MTLHRVGWYLRGLRRCPRCRLTWESRATLNAQDGVCHDCFADDYEIIDETHHWPPATAERNLEILRELADRHPEDGS